MTPERLSEIRALSKIEVETFNSFTEERPSSGEMQAALREVLTFVDDLVRAEVVESAGPEVHHVGDGVALVMPGFEPIHHRVDERGNPIPGKVPDHGGIVRPSPFAEFDSLNPGDVVGAKGEEYTVVERDFPRDGVKIQTASGNEYLLYSEAWAGSFGWTLISRAVETGNELLEIPEPTPGKCKVCEREIPIGETAYFNQDGSATCHDCTPKQIPGGIFYSPEADVNRKAEDPKP